MGIVSRVKTWIGWGGLEGSYRGPATGIGEFGGHYPIPFGDGFQQNLQLVRGYGASGVPAVYGCVMSFARAISQCYPAHKRTDEAGNIAVIRTSPASRILRQPNAYETWPQFIFNVCAQMGFEGEALALIVRDDRFAPVAFHLCRRGSFMPYIEPQTREIFYSIGDNPLALASGETMLAPAREVIHFRQHTPRHPLIGESAVKAAALAMGINVALSATQAAFFTNMARPSGVLSTDQALTRAQMTELRAAFKEQSAGLASGELPILANGLKFQQLAVNSVDAQLIESQRMSVEEIARAYGVPLPLIGDLSHATLNNTESLVNLWRAVSLGAWLENIERSFDRAFEFGQDDYVELDVAALMRSDFLQRVDGLTKGIQGGLYTVDDARRSEGLSPAKGGAEPLLQAQMTPLSMLKKLAEKAAEPPPPPMAPKAPAANDDEGDAAKAEARTVDPVIARALVLARLADKRAAL